MAWEGRTVEQTREEFVRQVPAQEQSKAATPYQRFEKSVSNKNAPIDINFHPARVNNQMKALMQNERPLTYHFFRDTTKNAQTLIQRLSISSSRSNLMRR